MKDYIRLIRPVNLLFLVILIGLMEKYVVRGVLLHYQLTEPITWWMLLLMILAVVLIAAGGYVINDYFDIKIDLINHPERVIVSRGVSKTNTMLYFQCLTGGGIACGVALAVCLKSMALGCTFVLVPGILWFYSASYKRQFLIGNLTIAFLAGLVPLLVGFACDASISREFGADSMLGQYLINRLYVWVGGFGAFAFLCTWMREIVKDMEDQEGDRELECHTLPVMYGELASKITVSVLLACVVALMTWVMLALQPLGFSLHSSVCRFYILLCLMFAASAWLLWRGRLPQDYRRVQLMLKATMLAGTLFAFVVPSIL